MGKVQVEPILFHGGDMQYVGLLRHFQACFLHWHLEEWQFGGLLSRERSQCRQGGKVSFLCWLLWKQAASHCEDSVIHRGKLWGTSQRQLIPSSSYLSLALVLLSSFQLLLFPSWFSLALLFSSSPTSVLSGTLFSPFLFSSHLFPVPFSPHFTPLPCVNSPWWSSSQTQLQTDFRMLFLSAETWRAGQCSQYSSALAILLPGSVFHDTQICSYKKTLLCFCFIPVVSVGASFHKFLWHPVSLRQTCSKEFWFSVAPKIPFLCFNKGTGHIWSFCYISVQRGIWFISETCCTEFISLLHDSKRSVNILRTQEVPDKRFLVSCFCVREYWLI